jgi:hypothetical protein
VLQEEIQRDNDLLVWLCRWDLLLFLVVLVDEREREFQFLLKFEIEKTEEDNVSTQADDFRLANALKTPVEISNAFSTTFYLCLHDLACSCSIVGGGLSFCCPSE